MLLVLLLACGVQTSGPQGSGVAFPHAADYRSGAAHGAEVLQLGEEACVRCHQPDASAPTCDSCHDSYPHPTGWLAGTVHGAGVGGSSGAEARAACQECHAAEGFTAQATASCTACHAYPHESSWRASGQHGAHVLLTGSADAACGSCHGMGIAGSGSAVSCTNCHPSYPHAPKWAETSAHGAAAVADVASCAGCHGALGEGGPTGVACSRCHTSFPHPVDWSSTHIATTNTVGAGVCLDCHELGDGPAAVLATCGRGCHWEAP